MIASLISTMLPLATCVLIPFMLPASKQDEKVDLSDEISPWSHWRGNGAEVTTPVRPSQVARESDSSGENTPQNIKIGGRHEEERNTQN